MQNTQYAEVCDHPHPDVIPPVPRTHDGSQELVGELEAARDVDGANDWMAAALGPDRCLEEVVLLARQTTEGYDARGMGTHCVLDIVERSLRH
jgi:hypothetical protein